MDVFERREILLRSDLWRNIKWLCMVSGLGGFGPKDQVRDGVVGAQRWKRLLFSLLMNEVCDVVLL